MGIYKQVGMPFKNEKYILRYGQPSNFSSLIISTHSQGYNSLRFYSQSSTSSTTVIPRVSLSIMTILSCCFGSELSIAYTWVSLFFIFFLKETKHYLYYYTPKIQIISSQQMQPGEETKRKFLRNEILDAGYQPQLFTDFLMASNTDSDEVLDIDKWSLQQLKNLVAQFKALNPIKPSKNKSSIISPPESNIDKVNIESSTLKSEQANQQKISNEKKTLSRFQSFQQEKQTNYFHQIDENNKQLFTQIINCQKYSPSSLLNANVSIQITKFVKKQGGVFEQSYVVYYVQTKFLGKAVQRRYNDFCWLREMLEYFHPGLPIPPVAKKGQFRRYDEKHLRKRMIILQKFLNRLLQIPQIRADPFLQNFLKIEEYTAFEKFKANFKKSSSPLNLQNVKNLKGSLSVIIDPKVNFFLREGQRTLFQTNMEIKKIEKEFKGVATMLEGASIHLKNITRICKYVNNKQNQFKAHTEMKSTVDTMYTLLSQLAEKYQQSLLNHANIFRNEIYSMLKYQHLFSVNLLEGYDKLRSFQKIYQQQRKVLAKKKQKLQKQKQPSPNKSAERTSQLFAKEYKQLNKTRQIYGVYNFQLYEEVNRHYMKNNMHAAQSLHKVIQKFSRFNSEGMMSWIDLLTKAMALQEGKSINNTDIYIGK